MRVQGKPYKMGLILILMITVTLSSVSSLLAAQGVLKVSGSSTIQPVMEKVRDGLAKQAGLTLEVKGGGSGAGYKDALNGVSDVGAMSRALSAEEKGNVEYVTVGLDALVMIVNERNSVSSLDKNQVISLFKGRTKNWKELGGQDTPVVLVSKEIGRSTLELFEGYSGIMSPKAPNVNQDKMISPEAYEIGSNLESLTLVGGIPGAIGYVSMGTAQILEKMGMPIKAVKLDGVVPSKENVLNQTYPILRELNLVYKPENTSAFELTQMLLTSEGQNVVSGEGFIPIKP